MNDFLSDTTPKAPFISWVAYQRRTESLAKCFNLEVQYCHYFWEERSRYLKVLSYLFKFVQTLITLFRSNSKVIFIQLAPAPLLYAAAIYCWLKGASYISDCHNTMVEDGPWIKLPMVKYLLRKSAAVLIHNEEVMTKIQHLDLPVFLLRDPIPDIDIDESIEEISHIQIKKEKYVLIPCSYARDEPLQDLFKAIRAIPDVLFVATWFAERMPSQMRKKLPSNVCLTGFLGERQFNALYAHAAAAIVLTDREYTQPSGASEAISLAVPLIVSGISTTRRLYRGAIFVDNNSSSIAEGIKYTLLHQLVVSNQLKDLKYLLNSENNHHLSILRQHLSLNEPLTNTSLIGPFVQL